jgi:hypothetical protein
VDSEVRGEVHVLFGEELLDPRRQLCPLVRPRVPLWKSVGEAEHTHATQKVKTSEREDREVCGRIGMEDSDKSEMKEFYERRTTHRHKRERKRERERDTLSAKIMMP